MVVTFATGISLGFLSFPRDRGRSKLQSGEAWSPWLTTIQPSAEPDRQPHRLRGVPPGEFPRSQARPRRGDLPSWPPPKPQASQPLELPVPERSGALPHRLQRQSIPPCDKRPIERGSRPDPGPRQQSPTRPGPSLQRTDPQPLRATLPSHSRAGSSGGPCLTSSATTAGTSRSSVGADSRPGRPAFARRIIGEASATQRLLIGCLSLL